MNARQGKDGEDTINPKISVVILFNDSYEVGHFCSKINAEYCRRHGYKVKILVLSDVEMKALCEGRHFAWGKVALLRYLLGTKTSQSVRNPIMDSVLEKKLSRKDSEELLEAEWIAWLDADLMVLNHSWPLSNFVSNTTKDLVLGEDMADLDWLNTGLMLCRVASPWIQSLWDKVWKECDATFHQGEFWDQSALCGCLSKWGELSPTVVGGVATEAAKAASKTQWFSWQGGPRVRETQHLKVLDAGGTQSNNPRYARFAFHAAGMKDKLRSCRHILELGAVQNEEKCQGPWGWPLVERQLWPAERPIRFAADWKPGQQQPALLKAESLKELSLLNLSETELGDCQVEMVDKVPPLALDPPPSERPFSQKCHARLWEAARYVVGTAPAAHGALQAMDPKRSWQCTWRPFFSTPQVSPLPPCVAALDLPPQRWSCRLSPPTAEMRMHQPEAGSDGSILWQLEGHQQVLLLEKVPEESTGSPLLRQGQSVYSPWNDGDLRDPFSVVLSGGEALCVPKGWWCSTRSLSPSVCLSAPLGEVKVPSALQDLPQEYVKIAEDLVARSQAAKGAPIMLGAQLVRNRCGSSRHQLCKGHARSAAVATKRCNAVCHVQLYMSRKCLRTSRIPSAPEVCVLGASQDSALGPLEDILRNLFLGERCLVAVGTNQVRLLDIQLLDVILPEPPAGPEKQDFFHRYMRAWWTWFEDPSKWQPLPTVPWLEPLKKESKEGRVMCHRCGAGNANARCSACGERYCSKSCQREDWSYHRGKCVESLAMTAAISLSDRSVPGPFSQLELAVTGKSGEMWQAQMGGKKPSKYLLRFGQLLGARPFLAFLSGFVVAVLLAGCGDDKPKPTPSGGSTTTPGPDTPAGPIECPADFKRGHCTKCYYSGGSGGETTCQDCSSPYKLTDKKCAVSCSDMPTPPEKPGMPDNAQSYNGMTWPSTCFDEEEIHFFTVGDWGGVCDWGTGKCSDGSNPYAGQYPELKGKPFPMPNRRGAPLSEPVDWMAQNLVATRMKEKADELKKDGKEPKFVLNVGDNFYPGGVDTHCSNGSPNDAAFTLSQFAQVFEQMYPVEDLGNIEWWSVLGNHDYGGVCYIKGWDQQIFYTFKPNGRWVMPAQYWRRSVQFKTYSVDFFFLDTNILDSWSPELDPGHNLCSSKSNPGEHCEIEKYPVKNGTDGASCSATGPTSPEDCEHWFEKLWSDQKKWFVDAVQKSTADWQIVVMPGHSFFAG
eukprot:symbB.v1.2.006477.t1/scaffold377.1/size217610/4